MVTKVCEWCGEEFEVKSPFSRDKYCDKHKDVAKKERGLKKSLKYYNNNKKKINIQELGTTSLGPRASIMKPITYLGANIKYSEFIREQKVIQNSKNSNSGVKGRVNSNRKFFDYSTHIEYGESQPLGIQNTHKGASFNDYVYTGRYYAMKGRAPCPECHSTEAVKDVKHCLISCKQCGLILEVTPSMVAPVSREAQQCTTIVEKGKGNRKDKKTIDTEKLKTLSFKSYWIQFKGVETP